MNSRRPTPPSGKEPPPPRRPWENNSFRIWLVLILLLFAWQAYSMFNNDGEPQANIPYTLFLEQVQAGNVTEVTMVDTQVSGEFRTPIEYQDPDTEESGSGGLTLPGLSNNQQEPQPYSEFRTTLPSIEGEQLLNLLRENNVLIRAETPSTPILLTILLNGLPFLLLIGLLVWSSRSMRQAQGNIFQFGQSRAEKYSEDTPAVTFNDIAGEAQAKLELTEVVDFLKNPERYMKLGAKIPRGVLLVGPPGTGKTLLARAVAGEAGAPFFNISGSEFVELFVGVGASRVRDLFDRAKKEAPAIVFIDEIDAVGRRRGTGLGGGNDEREQTLNQILTEMDGFEGRQTVIVIAATNRPDVLDPALLRPGRFDRQVTVGLPDRDGRLGILKIHTKGKPLDPNVSLDAVARSTPGFSGADLANLANEAALHAAREGHTRITQADFDSALDKIVIGIERAKLIDPKERNLTAYHEAGHAVVGLLVGHDPIRKVTIIPRGPTGGVTAFMPEADRGYYPRGYLLGMLAVNMGGRAAEELVIGEITTGAQSDLAQSAKIARRMVTQWGMSEELGVLAIPNENENPFLGYELSQSRDIGEGLATQIDLATRRIVEEAHQRALQLLRENRPLLDGVAEGLLKHETLDGAQVKEIWETYTNKPVPEVLIETDAPAPDSVPETTDPVATTQPTSEPA
jgi:cell division protease FtsH